MRDKRGKYKVGNEEKEEEGGVGNFLFLVCNNGGWFTFIYREDGAQVHPSW